MGAAYLRGRPSGPAPLGGMVMDAVRGGEAGKKVVREILSGQASSDALLEAFLEQHVAGGSERLRAFARAVQKAIESHR